MICYPNFFDVSFPVATIKAAADPSIAFDFAGFT